MCVYKDNLEKIWPKPTLFDLFWPFESKRAALEKEITNMKVERNVLNEAKEKIKRQKDEVFQNLEKSRKVF
jgi:hypothetical protein